ncbi:MAG: N,N-dimethylformamidase beta subunit family domain-containing protein [Pseudomonadota bacterium]
MARCDDPSLSAQPGSRPRPRVERRANHILDNYYISPARDPEVLEIWAYTDSFSYEPGDMVGLRVHTTAEQWDLEIGRDGTAYEPVLTEQDLPGREHETPVDCSVEGCGWPVAYAFEIPADWRSGGYLVTLTARRGDETVEEHHLFIVRRSRTERPAPILLLCATGTWVAYNCWGGSNAYEGIIGPTGDRFSPVLSTLRPWTRGFCKLPPGAPRAVPDVLPEPGEMVRYPYMEWAYAYGYSKKYASAGWASYERHFACWAEAEGFQVDVATLHDLDADPALLDGYKCAVFVGHDEYWSAAMRDAVDAWVEDGGRVARFAGNFLWQVRVEDGGHTQVCHKYFAAEQDPYMGTDRQHLLTGAWEIPEIDRPGALTFGVNGMRGVYAGLGNCIGRGAGGFTIYRPEHWAFEGAHLGYGDVLGAQSRIYGYEVDGLDHIIRDGLPYPTGGDGASEDISILGLGLGTNVEADHGVWGEHLYIGDSGAAWKALALTGEVTPETLDRAVRGNGMIVSWPRGRGEVFTAATCEWVMGLTRRDRQVEQVTRNVLNRFTQ